MCDKDKENPGAPEFYNTRTTKSDRLTYPVESHMVYELKQKM